MINSQQSLTAKIKEIANNNDVNYNIALTIYIIETFLAEKIETILRTMEVNSRMKDYYDIYIIYKTKHATLDKCNFKKAIKQTFRRREFNSDEYECLNVIKNSSTLAKRWQGYSTKNLYARNINFEDTVLCLKKLIDLYKN